MKNLYRLQTLLVVLFSSMITSWTFGQFAEPITVNVRNSGSSFSDQFPASTDYDYGILDGENSPYGLASIIEGGSQNTLKVMFTPNPGAIGTEDVIVHYFTLSSPMHPVTKWYRFIIADEIVINGDDKFLVDQGATEVPLDVLSNDSVSNGSLVLTTVSVSNAGNTIINSDGSALLFTPEADFLGDTWIQYIACDSSNNCGQGTAHILVRDPAAQDHLILKKFLLNTEDLKILAPSEDFEASIEPSHGTLTSDGQFGWVYTPDANYTGTDTFELSLLNYISRKYTLTVYAKNANIHARNDKFYVRPGLSVTFNVLNNDLLDYEVSSHSYPAKGVLNEVANGLYTYTPNTGYRGVDKFTYTTCFQDTVYCETATVYIHVTDLEPDNQFSYALQTSKDIPLMIDYPIDYTDFSYIISQQPAHGEVVSYTGVQEIGLSCDTTEGFNLIVYRPEQGYTGPDHFEYYYCIQPSNLCYLVQVDMNVIDHPEIESCPCTVGCVWPGDSDQDGRVDMNDLLAIGNKLGESGPYRNYLDPSEWFGQHTTAWPGRNGAQFMDANGDGTITAHDVDQISEYYYDAHDVVVRDVQQKLPYQFSIIPVQYSLDSGDVVILDIAVGSSNYPVLDLKGAKFSINLPSAMMDSTSVEVLFHQDSWLAEGSPFISLGKVPWDGRVDAGMARATGNGATGFGVIATVVFIIEEDVEGFKTNGDIIEIPVTLLNGGVMDSEGTLYDIEGDEFVLIFDPHKANKNQYNLIVYPNPAQDILNIHLNGKTSIESINLIDPQGRMIRSFEDINLKQHQMDVSSIPAGLYYLQVNHAEGTLSQLLSVIR